MTRKDITKLFTRFFITFFCCLPVFLVVGFLLDGKISAFVMTVIFVVIGGGIFALEEFFYFKRKQKRELLKQQLKEKSNKK